MASDDGGNTDRLEDVFQDEIIKRFCSTEEFFKFAMSRNGLVLDHLEVQHIKEDNRYSVEEQKFYTLQRWRQSQGAAAIPQLIRDIVDKYLKRNVSSDSLKENDGELPDPIQYSGNTAPGSPAIDPDVPSLKPSVTEQTSEGPEVINITNIHGPIHGPVIMGNEQVSLGGNAAPGPPAIDPDVPSLKPSSTEITREKTEIAIGGSILEFPPLSVREDIKSLFACSVDPSPAPEGCTFASSVLSCNPKFQGLKYVKIALATWCLANGSVEATIFSKNNEGNWDQLDEAFLTEEGHLELQNRSIDNLAAFVPTNRLSDIQFKISCFLFNNADMKFAMGFCLHDKAIENIFLHSLKKKNFFETIKNLTPLTVSLGDEIFFRIAPGQRMQNTKLDIDEQFVSTFQGHISYCKPDNAAKPYYKITQQRGNVIVSQQKNLIPGKDPTLRDSGPMAASFSGRDTNVEFRGKVKADNFIGKVENADIDMRSYEDGDVEDDAEPFWQENKLTYKEAMKKKERALKRKDERMKELRRQGVLDDGRPSRPGGTNVTFYGEVEAKTMITNAKNVRIDQRRYKGKNRPKPPEGSEVEKLVKAEQERGGGGVGEDSSSSSDAGSPRSPDGPEEEVEEQPDVENTARPIWNDCEKQKDGDGKKSSEQLDDNGRQETISGSQEQYREDSVKNNMAEPIWDDGDPKADEGTDSEQTIQDTTSSVPEISLRERRGGKRKSEETAGKHFGKEKRGKKSYDGLHVVLGLSLVFCVVLILFNSYGK